MPRPSAFTGLPVPPGGIRPGLEERDPSSPGRNNPHVFSQSTLIRDVEYRVHANNRAV